jgi:hypothetical protein
LADQDSKAAARCSNDQSVGGDNDGDIAAVTHENREAIGKLGCGYGRRRLRKEQRGGCGRGDEGAKEVSAVAHYAEMKVSTSYIDDSP